ncbi:MAG: hypothetical protein H6739_30525 [Alphaproteobacteria bacterium]|nr:hypothetical protein [Alphaproteobacteria bacterium]
MRSALCGALLLSAPASAGPWIRDPGAFYGKLSVDGFAATDYADPRVRDVAGLRYRGLGPAGYLELGVAPHVQVVAQAPFVFAANTEPDTGWRWRSRGFGDPRVGVGVGGRLRGVPLSLHLIARVPATASPPPPGAPALGDPQVDLSLIGAVGGGWSWRGHTGWALAEAGYLRRTDWSFGPLPGDYVDGLPCHLQVGWTPTREERRLGWVGVDATGQLNLGQSDWSRQAQTVGLFGAVDLGRGLAVEASWSWTWAAVAASRGHGASLGVSWTGSVNPTRGGRQTAR